VTIAERYTNELCAQYNYLATWYPSIKLTLGDIGTFNRQRIFVPLSEIAKQGLELSCQYSPATTDFSHQSATDFDYHLKLAGESDVFTPHLPSASAGIGMRFRGEGVLFFQLGGVTNERVSDQITLARNLLQLAKNREWERDWVVVTEVIRAQAAVILVSDSDSGTAELTVDADISALGLKALTAGGAVSLMHSQSLDTKITGAGDLTPLFRAVRIKRRWFTGQRQVSPAYSSDVEQFVSAREPDPSDVLEELSSYSDVEGGDLSQ